MTVGAPVVNGEHRSSWIVEHARGDAGAFHDRPWPDPLRRTLWWFEADRPTVVLGSTQPLEVIDARRAAAAGVAVVRRRSGGGAVWLAPGDTTWVDLLVPAGDRRWEPDVGRAAHWVGEVWAGTLADLGWPGAVVHRGPMVRSPWSDLVCFAGLGPGEVTRHGRKVVGISQRRTRAGARFQCALVHVWDPGPLLEVVDLDEVGRARARDDLAEVAEGVAVPGAAVVDALVGRLHALDR